MTDDQFIRSLSEPLVYLPVLTLLGLTVGSFLNVVIYRLPKILEAGWRAECHELLGHDCGQNQSTTTFNLAFPNSHCPQCKAPIKAWQNIPVLSWLLLKGKCHTCKAPISVRYPLVELTSGLLCLAIAWQFGASLTTLALMAFTWVLITLTLIDADTMLLPDNLTLPLLWAGLLVNYFGLVTDLDSAFWGAVAGYGVLWAVFWLFKMITGKDGMGYGDFKLLAALGAWLGWQMLPVIVLLSSLVGAAVGIGMIIILGRDKQVPIPFGPYLAAAGWLAMMWGDLLTQRYLQFSGLN